MQFNFSNTPPIRRDRTSGFSLEMWYSQVLLDYIFPTQLGFHNIMYMQAALTSQNNFTLSSLWHLSNTKATPARGNSIIRDCLRRGQQTLPGSNQRASAQLFIKGEGQKITYFPVIRAAINSGHLYGKSYINRVTTVCINSSWAT